MTKIKGFYGPMDDPSDETKEHMWHTIESSIRGKRLAAPFIADRRSFFYGIAASIILMFTSVGVYTVISNIVSASRPESIRLDSAYESAIRQFEGFVPAVTSVEPDKRGILSTSKEQLQSLDAAIAGVKNDLNGHDLSPLKRSTLRQLYSMKLHLIQQMIEQGEIEL